MSSPTERLRILTAFRRQSGLSVEAALGLLSNRYQRIEGWWCADCECAVTGEGIAAHEAERHAPDMRDKVVHHLDGNPYNNDLANLAIVDAKDAGQ